MEKKFVEKCSDCEMVESSIGDNFVCTNPSPDEVYTELLSIFGDPTLVGNKNACILHLYLPFAPTDRDHELRIVHCFSKTTEIREVLEVVKRREPILHSYHLCMVQLPTLPQQTPTRVQEWLRQNSGGQPLYEGLSLEAARLYTGAGKCACVYVALVERAMVKQGVRKVTTDKEREEEARECEVLLGPRQPVGLPVGLPVGQQDVQQQEQPEIMHMVCGVR